jgi:glucose/arabinose dehydrogenase
MLSLRNEFLLLLSLLLFQTFLTSQTLPSGFQDTTVFSGLSNPTAFRFAPDGRVFVAQKDGRVFVYSSITATTPTLFADLSAAVDNYWDRGLLGLALDPNFTNGRPYVYVLYTYDRLPNGTTVPQWNDACPSPPGATTDGCVVTARLSRLEPTGTTGAPNEIPLITDWCQQFPSHSIGTIAFGPDGALYVGSGDGASFNNVDYGQYGGSPSSPTSKNPCGDPPAGVGGTETPPTAEGGALRSQSVRRAAGEAISLDGSILRIDPNSGGALSDNPLFSNPDANAKRIIASGLRNPFRFTFRPATSEIWIGDVGWNTWEEINRIVSPTGSLTNFGWPCYEGANIQSGYQSASLNICQGLYNSPGSVTAPYYTYNHSSQVVSGETCPTGSSSITGIAFYTGSSYPSTYLNALFFADHTRNCIWAMLPGTNGLPNPSNIKTFVANALHPVMLESGPNGDIFYADLEGGTIRRIQYAAANQPPVAVATANPTTGPVPLTVQFDGSGSHDPDGTSVTYSWDLNGDGIFGDSTIVNPTFTYNNVGVYTVRLKVTDSLGVSSTSSPITISAGNTPPGPQISNPSSTKTWSVGQNISFSGSASDQQDGTIPASRLSWSLVLYHCDYFTPTNCHSHNIQSWTGISGGTFRAPDHEYPCYLVLTLTATDSGGLSSSTSLRINPQTVNLSFVTAPTGLSLVVNGRTQTAPFTRTVVLRSNVGLSAPTPQVLNNVTYNFGSWSDGGAQTHNVTAKPNGGSFTATYTH